MSVKILIIRFSSIGDIVLTSPVIRCLKQQLEGEVQLHYLTKNSFKSILSANPYLTKIIGIEKTVDEVIPELIEEGYDYIIDLHKNLRSRKVKRNLSGLYFTFDKLNWEKWLLVNFKINRMPHKHIVDRYLDAVKLFGIINDNKGLDYFISDEDEVDISLELPSDYHGDYVGFVIGGTYVTKKIPIDLVVNFCNKSKTPILLLGGPEDKTAGDDIVSKVTFGQVFNVCGKFSINQSASLVKQAKQIVSGDTGLMHVAAAFKKDIISVWGNTVPQFGMYPYLAGENSIIIENKDLNCRPCSKLGFDKCPKKHFKCMNQLEL